MPKKRVRAALQWRTMDLHIHTPASSDYQQPDVTYLQILQRAEQRSLDIIAFTDHNTVAGYRRLHDEIEQLQLLERLKRILPEEQTRLHEYRRLLDKVLVLPAFEFTATFGFHIMAIFSPEKPLREIEFLLLDLNIPKDQLDNGSATVGATTDVISAYKKIDEAGGIVIAAHANSSNGVAMRGFPLGGQTKISYTQDEHLHALEVTDLDAHGPRATAAFFNGTKPEYPRRMHCIQGSDSHRLAGDMQRKKNLGLGDRATDVNLPEVSFEALHELFLSNDFARTRPHRQQAEPAFDFVRAAREEGNNIVQAFHESAAEKGGKFYAILADVGAFANTNGGTLYVGLSADPKKPVVGLDNPEQVVSLLEKEIGERITPPIATTVDAYETSSKKILRVLVPRGDDSPYVVDDYKVYVRDEDKTELAVRDEIVRLVLRGRHSQAAEAAPAAAPAANGFRSGSGSGGAAAYAPPAPAMPVSQPAEQPPRTGVEVVTVEERDGSQYFTMRDLRNGSMVKNVTRTSARRLWHYAITQYSKLPADPAQAGVDWQDDLGLLRRYDEGAHTRYDLLQRYQGGYHYYFGVTDDGIHGRWKALVGADDE